MGKHTAYPSVVTSTGLFITVDRLALPWLDGRPLTRTEALRRVDYLNRAHPSSAPFTIKAV